MHSREMPRRISEGRTITMEHPRFRPRLDGFYDISTQETAYLRALAAMYFDREQEEKRQLLTRENVEQRRALIRQRFRRAIVPELGDGTVGVLPDRDAPLGIRVRNEQVLDDGVTLQNLTYETLPGVPVSASLFLARSYRDGSLFPAVLLAIGHAAEGRAYPNYVIMARLLAGAGIVTLSVDPPGQGERVQYPGDDGKSIIGGPVAEHLYMGLPCMLAGIPLAAFFIRDLERGLDLLETLPCVDPARLGITGCSGGGTMTCYMALWDDRIAAAAPSCYTTSREAFLLTGRPQDSEQVVPHVIRDGVNNDDFVSLFAPKPFLICGAAYDSSDIAATVYTYERAREAYRLYGAEENVGLCIAPTPHMLSSEHRRAIADFFTRVLHAPYDTPPEPADPYEGQHALTMLRASTNGCLRLDEPSAKTLYDCCIEYLTAHRYRDCDRQTLRENVLRVLMFPQDIGNRPPIRYPRFISDGTNDGVRMRKLWFFSEGETNFRGPRIAVAGVLYEPEDAKGCEIVVDPDTDVSETVERRLSEGYAVLLFSPRGIGPVRSLDAPGIRSPSIRGELLSPAYRRSCDAIMCGTSTTALRVYDCLRAYDLMRETYADIRFTGVGASCVTALLAALLTGTHGTAVDPPEPYEALVRDRDYIMRDVPDIPGMLTAFDLPLLIRAAAE